MTTLTKKEKSEIMAGYDKSYSYINLHLPIETINLIDNDAKRCGLTREKYIIKLMHGKAETLNIGALNKRIMKSFTSLSEDIRDNTKDIIDDIYGVSVLYEDDYFFDHTNAICKIVLTTTYRILYEVCHPYDVNRLMKMLIDVASDYDRSMVIIDKLMDDGVEEFDNRVRLSDVIAEDT